MSKTYTGTAVGLAYTDGLIDLETPVLEYLPEFRGVGEPQNSEITVRHALTMATGKPLTRSDRPEWRKDYFEIPFNSKPGTKYEYSCDDSQLLEAVVQKVTGESLHDYLKSHLFDEIGIDADNLKWIRLPDDSEIGCGGLLATAEDSLRLMKLYLDGGTWEGKQILAPEYVRQASTRQIDNSDHGYGFQVHMGSVFGSFYGAGSLGQLALAVPELDMVVVLYQTGIYRPAGQATSKQPGRSAEYFLKGVNAVFRTLLSGVESESLPEALAASGQLAERLKNLQVDRPARSTLPDVAGQISGRKFQVASGIFTLRDNLWDHIANREPFYPVEGCEWISFSFDSPDECIIQFSEHGETVNLKVGLDGVARLNTYALQKTDVDRIRLDGHWSGSTKFVLNARWVETCYSASFMFDFTPEGVEISLKRAIGDYEAHPLRTSPAIADYS